MVQEFVLDDQVQGFQRWMVLFQIKYFVSAVRLNNKTHCGLEISVHINYVWCIISLRHPFVFGFAPACLWQLNLLSQHNLGKVLREPKCIFRRSNISHVRNCKYQNVSSTQRKRNNSDMYFCMLENCAFSQLLWSSNITFPPDAIYWVFGFWRSGWVRKGQVLGLSFYVKSLNFGN